MPKRAPSSKGRRRRYRSATEEERRERLKDMRRRVEKVYSPFIPRFNREVKAWKAKATSKDLSDKDVRNLLCRGKGLLSSARTRFSPFLFQFFSP